MRKCTGQLIAKDSPEKLREHYTFMFKNSTQSYNGYIKSGIVTGKSWLCGKDKYVCDVCRENEKAGIIPLDVKFPSGHLYSPAGQLCRCVLLPETGNIGD